VLNGINAVCKSKYNYAKRIIAII